MEGAWSKSLRERVSGPPPSVLRTATSPSRGGLIQLAKEFGEIAVARLGRRRLEGAAERGGDARMGWRNVYANDPAIHVQFRRLKLIIIIVHRVQTMARGVSFVRFDTGTATQDR